MDSRITVLTAAVTALLLSACGSSDPASGFGTETGIGSGAITILPTITDRGLVPLGSDSEFYSALKAGLKAQSTGYAGDVTDVEVLSVSADTDSAESSASGSTESSADESSGNEVTSTNVQELNVDEQDWVKLASSGNELFILQSEYSYDYVDTPIAETTASVESSLVSRLSFAIPETYTSKLRVMGLDSETPDSSMISELDLDLSGRYAEGFYLYETDESTSAFISATGNDFWAYWSTPTAFSGVDSLITKVDLTDPSAPSVTSSFKFDGQIVSSRRIGNHLFFASRYFPTLPGEQPWTQSPEAWAEQVDSADLSDALPGYSLNGETESTPLISPSECFVAGSNSSNPYYSPDIITLASLNLDTMELSDSKCYLGATETLYASAEAVFLATTDYQYFGGVITDGPEIDPAVTSSASEEPIFDSRTETSIHQFDIDDGMLVYAGSGAVKGHLGWNPLRKPFRMSEKDGYLRVATFNDEQSVSASPILLTVLHADGLGSLETVSTLPNDEEPAFIGKPGEQLYASRFLGDRAFLVTFRQTDPLYIIDLADPANPRIAGELEIDGYSDYLQPIGQDYLLGIGKDAVAASNEWGDGRGAWVQGVKLSLFNVSDASNPTEVQSMLIGQRGTHSNALSDHRAITIQSATDAHPLRVSFSIDVYGETFPERVTDETFAFSRTDYSYSGLHGFDINVGDAPEIVSKGVLRVEQDQFNYGAYGVDRSVMVNDALFYITGSQVSAAHWDDLGNSSPLR